MSICTECGSLEYDPQCETCTNEMNKTKSEVKFLGPDDTAKELERIEGETNMKIGDRRERRDNNGTTR